MARLTARWHAGTLESCDLIERPVTGNSASIGKNCPQGIARVVSNKASKSAAGNSADSDQDSIGRSQPQISLANGFSCSTEVNPAGLSDLASMPSDFEFAPHDRFKPEGTSGNQIVSR